MIDEQQPAPTPASDDTEELAHYDDAIIGRAFRWSAVAAVLLALIGAGLYLHLHRRPAPAPVQVTQVAAPVLAPEPIAELPTARFTDITAASGITFTQVNGAYGDKLLPETMGGGVAFLDYDGDGYQDLLFVNSSFWPGQVPPGKQVIKQADQLVLQMPIRCQHFPAVQLER